MITGLVHLHNLLRWIIIILLLWNIVRHLTAATQPFGKKDKKLGLWAMIAAHITLVLGLGQYFFGNFGIKLLQEYGSEAMKMPGVRFWVVEHLAGMVLAILLITVARGIFRKANLSDAAKHRRALVLYGIALLLILVSVPWPWRESISRPLFPGMTA
jgi:Flp pilus assembly protein protease CpaA